MKTFSYAAVGWVAGTAAGIVAAISVTNLLGTDALVSFIIGLIFGFVGAQTGIMLGLRRSGP